MREILRPKLLPKAVIISQRHHTQRIHFEMFLLALMLFLV